MGKIKELIAKIKSSEFIKQRYHGNALCGLGLGILLDSAIGSESHISFKFGIGIISSLVVFCTAFVINIAQGEGHKPASITIREILYSTLGSVIGYLLILPVLLFSGIGSFNLVVIGAGVAAIAVGVKIWGGLPAIIAKIKSKLFKKK